MPYITQSERLRAAKTPLGVGELNYALTHLITNYTMINGLSYNTINAVVGALECAKTEYYRRIAIPYENEKCRLNGDVYK